MIMRTVLQLATLIHLQLFDLHSKQILSKCFECSESVESVRLLLEKGDCMVSSCIINGCDTVAESTSMVQLA